MTALGVLAAISGIALGRGFAHFFVAMVCLNLFTSAQGPLTEALMLAEMLGDTSRHGRVRLWGSLGFVAAVMAAGLALGRLGVAALPWLAAGAAGLFWRWESYSERHSRESGNPCRASGFLQSEAPRPGRGGDFGTLPLSRE